MNTQKNLVWKAFTAYVQPSIVLFLAKKKKKFFLPMQYGVGIVGIFLDSWITNLCKPPPPFYRHYYEHALAHSFQVVDHHGIEMTVRT